MSGKRGKIKFRCPVCGDGRPESAHAVTDDLITAHCFRCGADFLLMEYPKVFSELLATIGQLSPQNSQDSGFSEQDLREFWDSLPIIHKAENTRFSALPKKRFSKYEVFSMYNPSLQLCGLHFRGVVNKDGVSQKVFQSLGSRGLGFADSDVPYRSSFLRVVEGPYDSLSEQDVVLYGLPWRIAVYYPFPQHVILCPDGDFQENQAVYTTWVKFGTMLSRKGYHVEIELLPKGCDPDEVPIKSRSRISWRKFVESQLLIPKIGGQNVPNFVS